MDRSQGVAPPLPRRRELPGARMFLGLPLEAHAQLETGDLVAVPPGLDRFWDENDNELQKLFAGFRLAAAGLSAEIVILTAMVSDNLL